MEYQKNKSYSTTIVDTSDPTPPMTPPGTPDAADVGTQTTLDMMRYKYKVGHIKLPQQGQTGLPLVDLHLTFLNISKAFLSLIVAILKILRFLA